MALRLKGAEEEEPSERVSCGPVEEAKLARKCGVEVPRPKYPPALLTAVVDAETSAVPLKKSSWLVVKPPSLVPPFAMGRMPVKAILGETEPTTVKVVHET